MSMVGCYSIENFDPCFDPYGIITQWTGQILVDL